MRQVDFTICFNITVEEESLAVIGNLEVIVLQAGCLAVLNESRAKSSDDIHASAGIFV